MKNRKLNFYEISNKYIEYISKFDKHIAHSKNGQRPYIGIVLNINDILYFAPMFSPKPKHKEYKENLSFFKMYGNTTKTDYLGMIRFADMIPVPKSEVILIDITKKEQKYNMLLNKQYKYINQKSNKNVIEDKALAIYKIIMDNRNSKTVAFYKKICCNFKVLEEKYLEYEKNECQ